ncbi:HK97 gp10 family phage protein [Azospirillum baldaniorum]|uniref:HK97 gp10 family phage protein n=1 Tax=Azospirillum baldaniorum TaxID=1064539 RepID=UPI00157B3F80|nr:HK97 gp10 family phage protein [Azospirillum baldaniorum]
MSFKAAPGSRGGFFEFSRNLRAFADQIDATVEDLTKRLALAVYNGVISRTPVDTGHARSQWQILVRGDQVAVRPIGDHTAADVAALADYTVVGHGTILIANGAAYIKRLEYGHSAQAPEGFVRVTMADVQTQLDQIVAQAARENGTGRL